MERPVNSYVSVRTAKPNVLVVHPKMRVSRFIHGKPRVWDVDMLDNLVVPEDISILRSLAISQFCRDGKFLRSDTKMDNIH